MSYNRLKTAPNREKRYDTLSAFIGESNTLLAEFEQESVQQRIRTYSQSASDDLVKAISVISRIRKSVIIIHGPQGCSAGFSPALSGPTPVWASTQLDERDTIMGADEKLRSTAAALFNRHKPDAIIIVATPSVAINNDDVQSVVDELSEELGIPLIPVFVSGFSSKAAISGSDMAFHALLKFIGCESDKQLSPLLNIISVADLPDDTQEIRRLLDMINIPFQLLPDTADSAAFARAHQATATIGVDYDIADYAGKWLLHSSKVPFLSAPFPIGLTATREWLAIIAETFNQTSAAKVVHSQESSVCASAIASAVLTGKRVFIEASPSKAFGLHALVHELGGTTIGLSLTHFDRLHLPALKKLVSDFPSVTIHIGDNQTFETINIIRCDNPDLFIGTAQTAVQTVGAGIPTLALDRIPVLGYAGFLNFELAIRRVLRHQGFMRTIGQSTLPYKATWLERSPNWHIKQEVK
jgi:nitrogenase molybdenum-cofactor synthesis protein NifE